MDIKTFRFKYYFMAQYLSMVCIYKILPTIQIHVQVNLHVHVFY